MINFSFLRFAFLTMSVKKIFARFPKGASSMPALFKLLYVVSARKNLVVRALGRFPICAGSNHATLKNYMFLKKYFKYDLK